MYMGVYLKLKYTTPRHVQSWVRTACDAHTERRMRKKDQEPNRKWGVIRKHSNESSGTFERMVYVSNGEWGILYYKCIYIWSIILGIY